MSRNAPAADRPPGRKASADRATPPTETAERATVRKLGATYATAHAELLRRLGE